MWLLYTQCTPYISGVFSTRVLKVKQKMAEIDGQSLSIYCLRDWHETSSKECAKISCSDFDLKNNIMVL
jgi:hypothetical protein